MPPKAIQKKVCIIKPKKDKLEVKILQKRSYIRLTLAYTTRDLLLEYFTKTLLKITLI